MTFTELEAMEKVATEIYNRGFEDGKKAEYNDFKFSKMQNENKVKILDRIRAEIEFKSRIVLKDTPNDDWTVKWNECIKEVLEIIDKYKVESEEKG